MSYAVRVRRTVISLIVVVVAAIGGYLTWRWWSGRGTSVTYTTAPVTKGDVIQAVTASGTLSPVVKVDVGAQVTGRVQELFADYNDQVKAGQVIARIDPEVTRSTVTQQRARVTSARSDLARARATAANAALESTRALELSKSGAISKSEVDAALLAKRSAEAAVTGSQSQIVEAQAALSQAETSLNYTTIKSPIDGVVISRAVSVGQTVSASTSAPTLFTIAGDLRQMEVHTSVAESDVGQLRQGMRVEFTVDAFPDDTFSGTVKQVRYEATTVQNVVTYDAVVDVRNEDLKLRPGMTANATFVIAEARDVLVVSTKALRYRPPGAQADAPQGARRGGSGGGSAGGSGEGRRRWRDRERDGSGSGSGSGSGAPVVADGSGSGSTPAAAPRRRRPSAVWVLRAGKPERVRVETGLTDGSNTEITGGELKEGDVVIVADSTAKTPSGGPQPNQPFGPQRRSSSRGGRPAF